LRQLRLAFGAFAACLTLVFAPLDAKLSGPEQAKAQGVAVNIYVDRAQNEDFLANLESDGFVYEAQGASIRLANEPIMSVWKGGAPIQRYVSGAFMGLFESPIQFSPAFLVVDITNQDKRAVQITGAYLAVSESFTDRQPYMQIFSSYNPDCEIAKLDPAFQFANYGWGPVENAKLTYQFAGTAGPPGETYTIYAGTFDDFKEVTVQDGITAAGADVGKLQQGGFSCPSLTDIPACAQQLAGSGVLGNLADAIFISGSDLLSRVSGHLNYTWNDSKGGVKQQSSPFYIDIPILHFETPDGGPECGAGGPVERNFNVVQLPLDKANYRIPLPYSGNLAPQQNKRFALSLIADKSSGHKFRIVLDLADGTQTASPEIDLLYFLPRINLTN
jgi:hypothetical protein